MVDQVTGFLLKMSHSTKASSLVFKYLYCTNCPCSSTQPRGCIGSQRRRSRPPLVLAKRTADAPIVCTVGSGKESYDIGFLLMGFLYVRFRCIKSMHTAPAGSACRFGNFRAMEPPLPVGAGKLNDPNTRRGDGARWALHVEVPG